MIDPSAPLHAPVRGNPWSLPGDGWQWLRGNLHCHTTASDGQVTAQAAVDWYAGAGYHFLALTDHDLVTEPAALESRGLCLLRAAEVTAAGGELVASYHLITLGLPPGASLPERTTPVGASIDALRAQGATIFVAHPYWSGLTTRDLMDLPVAGIEILNGGTVLDSYKGEALAHWDEGLRRGARWWGIAVDDTHWHTIDRATGWVWVRARHRSPEAILQALADGYFYASAGPELRGVSVEREAESVWRVTVETSPCAAIYASGPGFNHQVAFDAAAIQQGTLGATIERTTFTMAQRSRPPHPYLRVQCIDWQRHSAWSNPFFL